MNLSKFQIEILKQVRRRNGELSWYRLDRLLSHDEFLPVIHTLGEVLSDLEANKMIRAEGKGAQPIYYITEVGQKFLSELETHPQRQAA